ncbi:DUF3850 domain-containing protein [Acidovorax sp.]|uniref:DUF3850 domain-containing protein n=1 Tax=Acidovorax sp. TaxID=1872122 RepID=UPI00391F044D
MTLRSAQLRGIISLCRYSIYALRISALPNANLSANEMQEITTVIAKCEPGYSNVWRLEDAAGNVVADLRIRPDAEVLAKRLAEGLSALPIGPEQASPAQIESVCRWLCERDGVDPDQVLDLNPIKRSWQRYDVMVARLLASLQVAPRTPAAPVYAPLTGRIHDLKLDSPVFAEMLAGRKLFEIRLDDKGYQCGDQLRLRETRFTGAEMAAGAPLIYTGREVLRRVVGILRGGKYGVAEGWVIMSLVQVSVAVASEAALEEVENAALTSSVGHLSALLDHQGALLAKAMQTMKALHDGLIPDESMEGVPATIPPHVLRNFVDANAQLLHNIASSSVVAPAPAACPTASEALTPANIGDLIHAMNRWKASSPGAQSTASLEALYGVILRIASDAAPVGGAVSDLVATAQCDSGGVPDNGQVYDEEIAPALLKLGQRCDEIGMPFLALAEWAPGRVASTTVQAGRSGTAFQMARIAAATAPNVDSFAMNLMRYCDAKSSDTSGCLFLARFSKDAP